MTVKVLSPNLWNSKEVLHWNGCICKKSACDVEDLGSIPGSGRSPGEGNGNLLQYSCLRNPMDRGASIQFSLSVVSGSLRPHGLQHTRLPCPTPTPGACSNSRPSSPWGHPTISSSVVPFSSCLQSFPASRSFLMSQFFASGGQKIGVSASSISPSREYSGLISFRIDWFDLLAVQGTLKSLLQHPAQKHQFFGAQLSLIEEPSRLYSSWGRKRVEHDLVTKQQQ